jgi:hypothetical protein
MKSLSEIYLATAAKLAEKAKSASKPAHKERFERMALAYQRLADKYRTKPWKKIKGRPKRGPKSKIQTRQRQREPSRRQ